MAKEPLTDRSWASAARNRYDDFVAIHANVTPTIHATGNFFTWHRYFLWMYEKALREECEYDGYQPVRLSMSGRGHLVSGLPSGD